MAGRIWAKENPKQIEERAQLEYGTYLEHSPTLPLKFEAMAEVVTQMLPGGRRFQAEVEDRGGVSAAPQASLLPVLHEAARCRRVGILLLPEFAPLPVAGDSRERTFLCSASIR